MEVKNHDESDTHIATKIAVSDRSADAIYGSGLSSLTTPSGAVSAGTMWLVPAGAQASQQYDEILAH